MAKTIVFIRGIPSSTRARVVQRVMELLNPDLNSVRAIKLALTDYVDSDDKGGMKAADKTVKNLVKKLIIYHSESHLVIDNENLLPPHWQSFVKITEEIGEPVTTLGIEVVSTDENADSKRANLQRANRAAFKCDMTKYIEVDQDDLGHFDRDFVKAL